MATTPSQPEQEILALEHIAPQDMATIQPATPMALISEGLKRGMPIEQLKELWAMQKEFEEREAERTFDSRMSKCQAAMKRVAPDLENRQTSSKYASYKALDGMIRPIYTNPEYDFSVSFDTGDCPKEDHVRVIAYVKSAGHKETRHVDVPADGKGARGGDVMTKTHATVSAISYGKRTLLTMIFNIAVGKDDDGNAAAGKPSLDNLTEHLDWISNAKDPQELGRLARNAADAAATLQDNRAFVEILLAHAKKALTFCKSYKEMRAQWEPIYQKVRKYGTSVDADRMIADLEAARKNVP